MADGKVKLPPGFVLEPQQGINLPPGFVLEQSAPIQTQPYQPEFQEASGFGLDPTRQRGYQPPAVGQSLVGAMKSLPSSGAMTGVETGYERPGQPVMNVDQMMQQATTPQNMNERGGYISGTVAQMMPGISGVAESAIPLANRAGASLLDVFRSPAVAKALKTGAKLYGKKALEGAGLGTPFAAYELIKRLSK